MASPPPSDTARSAGRGGLLILGAKIYFILVGVVQQFALKAVLGLGGYGAYSTAQSVASITYNPVVQTSIQGVSREISGTTEKQRPPLLRKLLLFHAGAACILASFFFLAATPLSRLLGAAHLEQTLQILSLVVFIYGMYAPVIGALNGLQRFLPQALLDILAATLRTVGLIGGAAVAVHIAGKKSIVGVEGANLGFALASSLVLLAALLMAGIGRSGETSLTGRAYAKFAFPVLGGQLLLNLLFQADSLWLRRFASDAAARAHLAPEAADPFVGAYRAAQLFCFLPYQLLMSITFVLFPLLASANSRQETAAVKSYVEGGVRLAAIASAMMVSVLVALPSGLIGLVYGQDAAQLGGAAMRPLAIGLGSFALIGVMTSALNSLGRPGVSLKVTALAVVLVSALCMIFARGSDLGQELLVRVGLATSIALIITTIYTAVILRRAAGGVIGGLSLMRILGCGVGASLTTSFILTGGTGQAGRWLTLAGSAGCALVFLLLLGLTGELSHKDLHQIQRWMGKK